jgi:hypothetical protein
VRYELLVQPKEAGAAWDPANFDKLLHERGAFPNPDGTRTWRMKSGDVQVRLLIEGGRSIATELRVELSDKLDLIRELVLEGVAVAALADARLVDPQLSKTLTIADEGLVADQYLRTAQYAGQYAGVSSAVLASYGTAEQEEGMKPGTKALLAIVGFFVAMYLVLDKLTS